MFSGGRNDDHDIDGISADRCGADDGRRNSRNPRLYTVIKFVFGNTPGNFSAKS